MFWSKSKKKERADAVRVDDRLQHIAFIMDGNGRWAKKRGMPREYGHTHGAATFKKIGRYCEKIGLKYMTVYAFSTENWKRPQKEVDAIMKRVSGKQSADGKKPNEVIELDHGGLKADLTARLVYIDGQRVDMSPKEYDLFFYMLKNRNIALSREKLICEVWGYDFYGDARTLDTHIKLLRKSLGRYSRYIATLRGVGYRFEADL